VAVAPNLHPGPDFRDDRHPQTDAEVPVVDDHPVWCSLRRCTAEVPAVNGHHVATHRSAPEASGLTEMYLVQSPSARVPSVELAREGCKLVLPLSEASGLGEAYADLRRATGAGL
jgi:hypothetical protein